MSKHTRSQKWASMNLAKADLLSFLSLFFLYIGLFTLCWTFELGKSIYGLGTFYGDESETIADDDECTPAQNDRYKSCACMVERTKLYVNLNGIIRNCTYKPGGCKVPRFTVDGSDKWDYAFHPCLPFSMFQNLSHTRPGDKACHNVAAARYTRESASICNSLGSQSDFSFRVHKPKLRNFVASNLTLQFKNSRTLSSAVISLVCNSSVPANESIFTFHGIVNNPSPTYYLALESICCCPGGCNVTFPIYNKDTANPSKGFWAIIGIVAGVILVMIVAIVFVKCTKMQKQSEERRGLLDPTAWFHVPSNLSRAYFFENAFWKWLHCTFY